MILKRELGVSIYPDHSDAQKDRQYLKRAAELGFTRLFMSMLEVSEGKENVTSGITVHILPLTNTSDAAVYQSGHTHL